jgi:hypothetical protein
MSLLAGRPGVDASKICVISAAVLALVSVDVPVPLPSIPIWHPAKMTSDYTDGDIPTTALRLSQHLIISTRTTGIYTGFPPKCIKSSSFLITHTPRRFLQQESPSLECRDGGSSKEMKVCAVRMAMLGGDLLVVGLDVLVTDVLPLFLFEIGKHGRRKRGSV